MAIMLGSGLFFLPSFKHVMFYMHGYHVRQWLAYYYVAFSYVTII